jgi:hypothetical protein
VRSALPETFRARIRSARELGREPAPERPPLATSLALLDRLLDGGLPRGRMIELVGRRTCGRFATVLAVLAASTGAGESTALVDLGDALDPRAAEAAGVDLERLLWLRPASIRQTLAAAEVLLEAGFCTVVVELGPPPVAGGRGPEAAWLRLGRLARERRAVLLVASPYRVSGTGAETVLAAAPARVAWSGAAGGRRRLAPLLTGLTVHLERQKHRGAAPGESGRLTLPLDTPWAAAKMPDTSTGQPKMPDTSVGQRAGEAVETCAAAAL